MPARSLVLIGLVSAACTGEDESEPLDTTGPAIALTFPAAGAQEVDGGTSISVVFDEVIDVATLTQEAFTVVDDLGEPVTGTLYPWATGAVFQPDAALAVDRAYTTTVAAAVTDAAGNPLAADVSWSFATHQRTWSPTEPVPMFDSSNVNFCDASMGDEGEILIAWSQTDVDGVQTAWSQWRLDGWWQTPARAPSPTAFGASPRVALTGAGDALIAYVADIGDSEGQLRAARVTADLLPEYEEVSAPFSLASESLEIRDVAINDAGDAVVVWQFMHTDQQFSLWANHYTGGAWSDPEQLMPPQFWGVTAEVELDDAGDSLVVWVDDDLGPWQYARHTAGDWTAASPVDGTASGFPIVLALAGDGTGVLLGNEHDGTRSNVTARRFTPAGGWQATEVVETDDANAILLDGADDDTGTVFVAWRGAGPSPTVMVSRSVSGGAWEAASPAGLGTDARIATDRAGGAMVVASWATPDLAMDHTTTRYQPGSGWGDPEPLGYDRTFQLAALTSGADGTVAALWNRPHVYPDQLLWSEYH